ncbi:RagB/SusD family nutrient uptake outer membrane protein [Bacteroides ovatus]|nr:RagB/SusD family nutrient uptake outer membrane protein [Bacteroides ovatus]
MLENIHKAKGAVTEEVYNRYAGEAYFCRACKYAELIFFYGDVPYQEETITISEALQRGRRPKAEVIPLVYADFDKAIAGLPESYGKDENIHPTKGAALAMKARFALYMGDYEIAAQAAKACMDLKLYSLEPDYAKLFKQSTKLNDEKVFVIPRSIENEVMLDSWIVKNGLPRNAGGYGSYNPSWDLLLTHISVLTGYLLTNHRCLILASLSRTVTRVVQ